jgi:hypothetical protein
MRLAVMARLRATLRGLWRQSPYSAVAILAFQRLQLRRVKLLIQGTAAACYSLKVAELERLVGALFLARREKPP